MMTRTRFTDDDWALIAGAPSLGAMMVLSAAPGSRVPQTMAVIAAYGAAKAKYETPLLQELLRTAPADAAKQLRHRGPLGQEATEALRRSMEILERLATEAERAEYRRFVVELAGSAARTRRTGGLLRRRRPDAGDGREALDRITESIAA